MTKSIRTAIVCCVILFATVGWVESLTNESNHEDRTIIRLAERTTNQVGPIAKDYGPCPKVRCSRDLDCRQAGGSQYCRCQVNVPMQGLHCGLYSSYLE